MERSQFNNVEFLKIKKAIRDFKKLIVIQLH